MAISPPLIQGTRLPITREKILEYLSTFGQTNQLSPSEAEQFVAIAQEFQLNPFKREIHVVYWTEAVQNKKDGTATSFWNRMPKFQLRKVAISPGFRLIFPGKLGGLYEAMLRRHLRRNEIIPYDT